MNVTPPDAERSAAPADGDAGGAPLLGLCPLLAVSDDAVAAFSLGVATIVALVASAALVSMLRKASARDVRLPVFVLLIGAVVTAIELAMRAGWPAVHAELGLFVPLIATNCLLLGRAERFASGQPARAARDGFSAGLRFAGLLLLIGAIREALAYGTLFAGAGALWGLPGVEMQVAAWPGFRLAASPAGAFLVLAALIALHRRFGRPGAAR